MISTMNMIRYLCILYYIGEYEKISHKLMSIIKNTLLPWMPLNLKKTTGISSIMRKIKERNYL